MIWNTIVIRRAWRKIFLDIIIVFVIIVLSKPQTAGIQVIDLNPA